MRFSNIQIKYLILFASSPSPSSSLLYSKSFSCAFSTTRSFSTTFFQKLTTTTTKVPSNTFTTTTRSSISNSFPILLPQRRYPRNNMSSSKSLSEQDGVTNSINRVALLQFHVTPSKATNHKTAESYISQAVASGAKLVVLPEIWNGPYATAAFSEYAEELPTFSSKTQPQQLQQQEESLFQYNPKIHSTEFDSKCPSAKLLFELAIQYSIYIIGGSISEKVVVSAKNQEEDSNSSSETTEIYNTCLCIDPNGRLIGKHRKVHLFDIDVPGKITFKESDTLSPGQTFTYFDAGDFGRIGVGICYDIRFPEYALLLTQKYQCNILVYPGAFNLTTGPAHWELLQRARAVDNQCYVLTASPARTTLDNATSSSSSGETSKYPHYTAWGHSTAVSPWGEVVATCDEKENIVICDLDMRKVKEMRDGIPTSKQKRGDLYRLVEE